MSLQSGIFSFMSLTTICYLLQIKNRSGGSLNRTEEHLIYSDPYSSHNVLFGPKIGNE